MSTNAENPLHLSLSNERHFSPPQLFQALLAKSSDALIVLDTAGTVQYASLSITTLLGYPPESLSDTTIFSLLHPDEYTTTHHSFQHLIQTQSTHLSITVRLREKTGSWRWLDLLLTNHFASTDIGAIVGHMRDATERKQAEARLRESESRYRALMQEASDIILITDPIGHILEANSRATEILGYSQAELLQLSTLALLHPADRVESSIREKQREIQSGKRVGAERRMRCKDGSYVQLEGTGNLLSDGRVINILRDITTRKELEQRKDDFISTTSHELRSPLATIKASLQLAQRQFRRLPQASTDEVINRVQELISLAERQVTIENRLVSDLLDVSRISQNKLELHVKLCNLLHVVRTVFSDYEAIEQQRPLKLLLPEQEMVPVIADSDRLGQVLSNYITNALKYSPADRPVTVMLETLSDRARVSVHDAGDGISIDEQARIWDRFYQAPDRLVHDKPSGLGLGLYICRTIIEQHQGAVGVESAPDTGTTFWFTLPLAPE